MSPTTAAATTTLSTPHGKFTSTKVAKLVPLWPQLHAPNQKDERDNNLRCLSIIPVATQAHPGLPVDRDLRSDTSTEDHSPALSAQCRRLGPPRSGPSSDLRRQQQVERSGDTKHSGAEQLLQVSLGQHDRAVSKRTS